ncbi:hypothetical protein GHT06_010336 [Daphnia sinensis]|uniref:Uncharacterized protein n=1 Tax=Daphnia sinensis TaxID=1820382 RepID=A0AAD5KY95_9CRUS|nr:hypothetical protein GHT06_010336 [Daphnia sinensis]
MVYGKPNLCHSPIGCIVRKTSTTTCYYSAAAEPPQQTETVWVSRPALLVYIHSRFCGQLRVQCAMDCH